MSDSIIRAGTMSELRKRDGDWAFIDLGFSGEDKTCGFLYVPATLSGEREPEAVALTFGALKTALIELVRQKGPPLHVVLEAPLSAAFRKSGNPLGRSVETREKKTRYWYLGLGCGVLVASLYLLRAIMEAKPAREIRLFEGLASFKDRTTPSNHIADVQALKAVVWSGGVQGGSFSEPAPMEGHVNASVASTLVLLGLNANPPPIIELVQPAAVPERVDLHLP